jgi:toluene monooxygenase system protein D
MTMDELANPVGPVIRTGEIADAVALAIEDDNPGRTVRVTDRGDYVRIEVDERCRLTRRSIERHLGRELPLAHLEIEMPSFTGRLLTRAEEYVWYIENPGASHG